MNTFGLDKDALVDLAKEQMERVIDTAERPVREKLALTCRILFHGGHDSGLAGQITARAEKPSTFYTQRLGLGFDEITSSSLLVVDEDLNVLEGTGMAIPANRFHSWIYRARPDVNCIVHTHAFSVATLATLGVPLQITQMDLCPLFEECAFLNKWPGLPFGNEEGNAIATALGDKRAILLAHHGMLVAASSVEEACVLSLTFERAAAMQLKAMAAGEIQQIPAELARESRDWMLRPKRMSTVFEYYARRVLREHPGFSPLQ